MYISQKYESLDKESRTMYSTVKFLNFRCQFFFAEIYLKFKQREKRPNHSVFCQKDANGIANSEDPDQTAPLGAQSYLSKNFWSLQYVHCTAKNKCNTKKQLTIFIELYVHVLYQAFIISVL